MEFFRQLRVRAKYALTTAALVLTAGFGVSTLFLPALVDATNQTIPYLINFQGRLTDNNGNVMADGSYNVKFRLFTVASGGSNVWEGDRVYGSSDHRVSVQNGLFDIQLGDTSQGDPALTTALFNQYTEGSLYLEVELPTPATATCASNGCASWLEGPMTPRQPLSSSPYAFNSQDLDGLDASAFGQITTTNAWTGVNTFTPTSGVALTVTPTASADAVDIKNSGGATQAYFDTNGVLNVAQTIQDTTTTVDLGTNANPFRTGYFGTSVQTPALNATTSGGTIATNAGTIQSPSATGLTIDLKNAANTTLAVTNSGGGVAGISATGGMTIGTGQTYNVGPSSGEGVTCASGQILNAVVVTGGVVTGGTCIGAGGGQELVGTWTSQQSTTATGTQTTVQFTGSANSAPSFNNGTHVLTLASNASELIVAAKGGGGGGGSIYDNVTSDIKGSAGGGEGGSSTSYLTSGLAPNYYFQLGGGGNGGAAAAVNPGSVGGNTCFGTNSSNACTSPTTEAVGGSGGAGAGNVTTYPAGGAGGAASSGAGDVTITGATGLAPGLAADTYFSGAGGGQGGGASIMDGASGPGNNGTSGGGGSGALDAPASATNRAGGNGGTGILSIAVYVTTAGTGSPTTLQTAYNNSTAPDIVLGSSGLTVDDNSTPVSGDLLDVQNNGGTVNYLAVNSSGISTSGAVTAAGDVNSTGGGIDTGGTQRIDNAGDLENVGSITASDNNTSGTINSLTAINSGASGTGSLSDIGITLNGTNTTGTNNITGINYANVTNPGGTNNFYGENFGTGYTDLLTYNGSTVIVNGTGQLNGAQLESGTVANGSLASSSVTINTAGGLTGGTVSLGGNLSLGVNYGSAASTAVQGNVTVVCPAGSGNLNNTGNTITLGTGGTCNSVTMVNNPSFSGQLTLSGSGTASTPILNLSGAPLGGATGATNSLVQLAGAISGGNLAVNGGTYIGINLPGSGPGSTADFLNFQKANAVELQVDNSGNVTAGISITAPTVNATSNLEANGTAGVPSTCTGTQANLGAVYAEGLLTTAGTCTSVQAAGNYLVQAPTVSATNTISPTGASTTGLTVKQTSTASPVADIFDVQGTNGTSDFIQVTSSAANQGGVTVQSFGTNAVTLQSGSGTVSLGSSTTLSSTGALSVGTGAATNLTLSPGTSGSVIIGGTTPAIRTSGATALVVDTGGAAGLSLGTSNANAITLGQFGVTTSTAGALSINSGANVPSADQFAISNASSSGDITANAAGLSINYKGGAAAVSSQGLRIDFAPGSTSGGTWSGMQIDANATGPVAGVTEYGLELVGPSSAGAGQQTGIEVSTGWNIGVDIQSGGIQLASVGSTTPSAPAAGNLKIYAQTISGKIVPSWISPSGLDTAVQAALYGNNITMWTNTGATAGSWLGTSGAGAGTYTTGLPVTTNLYTEAIRGRWANVVTTTNQQVGQRSTQNQFFRASTPGQGGFFFFARFGTDAWTAGDRLFVGLGTGTTAMVTSNPSTDTNILGFGIDAGDTAITFMHNAGSGTATKDPIASQPTLASNQGYDAYIYAKPDDSTVYYRLDNLNTGATIIDSSTTTNLPINTTFMAAFALMSNGANTAVTTAQIGLNRIYVETDH